MVQTAIVASAADYEVYGDLHYQTDGKQVFIVGYNSDTTNSVITIPSKIKGLPVTKIEDHAFDSFLGYDKNLRGIIIESGVKTIGNYAFSSQDKMTSIVLPSTLTSIGYNAFNNCESLEKITVPNSVTEIGDSCFAGCKSLQSASLSDNITCIDITTFSRCTNLTTIKFPSELKTIKVAAFQGCRSLTTVTLPNKLKTVNDDAFDNCINLDRVSIPSSVTDIGYHAFGYYDFTKKNETLVIGCYKGTAAEEYADKNEFKKVYLNKKIYNAKVTVPDFVVYSGKAKTPNVTVKLDGKTLSKGKDYTVKYTDNTNCGKATVQVDGIGEYIGTVRKYFTIKPAKVTAKKLVSPKTKSVKLTWAKADGNVDGYQVQVALNKKFTSGKKVAWVKKNSTIAKTVKGLKKGKVYYARVCAYKTIDGKKVFGAWSTLKKVKTK